MPAEESRVFIAIGTLQGQVTELFNKLENLRQQTTSEQRTVHDIVVATNEAIRNLTRTVERMEPHVREFQLKAASIDESIELAEDYREKRAEERGAEKFKKWLYGLAASIGGLIAVAIDRVIDKLFTTPTPPPPHP